MADLDLEMRLYLAKQAVRKATLLPLRRATADRRVLPDFLVIGAQKSGTSSLYEYTTRHPRVARAFLKEVHHFDGPDPPDAGSYRAHFPTEGWMDLQRGLRGGPVVTGEATPIYLFDPRVPDRVADLLPDVRLVAVLRDPVDRAWSHYHHEVRFGHEDLPFEEAVDREAERLDGEIDRVLSEPGYDSYELRHHSYVARGRYDEQIERWLDRFERDQLLVLQAEALFEDPGPALAEVFDHLGVGPADVTPRKAHNPGRYRSTMPGDVRRRLREHFAPHIARLEDLVGLSFEWGQG